MIEGNAAVDSSATSGSPVGGMLIIPCDFMVRNRRRFFGWGTLQRSANLSDNTSQKFISLMFRNRARIAVQVDRKPSGISINTERRGSLWSHRGDEIHSVQQNVSDREFAVLSRERRPIQDHSEV